MFTLLHIEKTGGTNLWVSGKDCFRPRGDKKHRTWWELTARYDVATVLRDPVERAISLYAHAWQQWAWEPMQSWLRERDPNIFEFYEEGRHEAIKWNLATYRLGGERFAKTHLRQCSWVGLTETLADDAQVLGIDVTHQNRSAYDHSRYNLTHEERHRIRELCRLDQELYEFVKRNRGATCCLS
jgi:hypothetical protein